MVAIQLNFSRRKSWINDAIYPSVIEDVAINRTFSVVKHAAQANFPTLLGSVEENGQWNGNVTEEVELIRVGNVPQRGGGRIVSSFVMIITSTVGAGLVFGSVAVAIISVIVTVVLIVLSKQGSCTAQKAAAYE